MKKKIFDELIESVNQALEHAKGERNDLRETILARYKGFTARIEFSDDDNVFVGHVLDITNIIGFHGETLNEAIKEFHGMIDFHIEVCEKTDTAKSSRQT
ncbi:MAG: hypothetical protein ACR2N3_08705 [Pyrinomonadaceae bacterium]